jgi:hypothetical protein
MTVVATTAMTVPPRVVTTAVATVVVDTAATSAALPSVTTVAVTTVMTALRRVVTTVVTAVGTAGTTGPRRVRLTAVGTTATTVADTAGTTGRGRVVGLTVGLRVRTVVGTAATSVPHLGEMTGVGAMSVLRRVVVGIRVGLGLGLLGMGDRPASRAALVLGLVAMTGRGLCRVGTSGPDTRTRLPAMIVDRVGTNATGRAVKSVAAAGVPIVSAAAGA